MPKCKNCQNSFPCKVEIEGKIRNLQRRKYCFNCSPFGFHNTKKIYDNKLSICKLSICKNCERTYKYDKSKGHQKNICNSCRTNKRRHKVKEYNIRLKAARG